jgi:hypothetical protein
MRRPLQNSLTGKTPQSSWLKLCGGKGLRPRISSKSTSNARNEQIKFWAHKKRNKKILMTKTKDRGFLHQLRYNGLITVTLVY